MSEAAVAIAAPQATNAAGDLVGAFRRFGEHGVAYEIIGLDGPDHVTVRVVETGETLRYPVAEVGRDPRA